jgi:hypothetical protein
MAATSRFRVFVLGAASMGIALLIGFALIEVALRAFPALIDLSVLVRFEPHLRAEIAERLGLRTFKNVQEITTEMRSDGGPVFRIPAPDSLTVVPADKVDKQLGAVEVVKVDVNGLCNVPEKAKTSRADIFVAGDSFVFCTAVTVENTAAHFLQEMSGLRVYNIGIGGNGPYEYVEMIKRLGPAFRPRLIFMIVYEGNDLRDAIRTKHFIENKVDLRKRENTTTPSLSYAAEFISANVELIGKYIRYRRGGENVHNFRYSAMVNKRKMSLNVTNEDQDEIINAFRFQRGEIDFGVFEPPLKEFVGWSNSNEITPIVAYIPSMYTAYAATVQFEDPIVQTAAQQFSMAQRLWFARQASVVGYRFHDITPAIQAAAASELTHFPANLHLTPKGLEIVAKELLSLLKELKIMPAAD